MEKQGNGLHEKAGRPLYGWPALPEYFSSVSFIFHPCGDPAADVPLGLVLSQNGLHLAVQRGIAAFQTLGQVFMYGAFADAELFGGVAHGGAVFDDIDRQITGAFLDVGSQ